jgi:hypothetical protein
VHGLFLQVIRIIGLVAGSSRHVGVQVPGHVLVGVTRHVLVGIARHVRVGVARHVLRKKLLFRKKQYFRIYRTLYI